MNTLSPSGLVVWPEATLLAVVVLLAAGVLRLALGHKLSVLAVLGCIARSSLAAVLVLALVWLISSVATLPQELLAPGPSSETLESAPLSLPSLPAVGPLYQTPFGSIADDVRLLPLEKSLPRAVTSSRAATPQRS